MTLTMQRVDMELPRDFRDEASKAVGRLRQACSALIAAVSDVEGRAIRSGADLQRALKIRSTLAWQIHRLATVPSPLDEAHAVPGAKAIGRVLEAASHRGVPGSVTREMTDALDAFEAMVRTNAGNRKTFRSMVAALGDRTTDNVNLQYRRDAFHANSHIWGAQVDALLRCSMVYPGNSPQVADFASLRGMQNIRRLRPNVSFRVSTVRLFGDDRSLQRLEPIESELSASSAGPVLLSEFGSQPPPQLIHRQREDNGAMESFLAPSDVGNRGASSVYLADVARGQAWRKDRPDHEFRSTASLRHPTRKLILDMLVHRDLFESITANAAVYGDLSDAAKADPSRWTDDDKLSMKAEVLQMGTGSASVSTPDLPDYPRMLRHVCDRLGWDAEQFLVYRYQSEYPVMFSTISMWLRQGA